MNPPAKLVVGALIFTDFELLDVFGPLEMYGMYPETFEIQMLAESQQPIQSAQGPRCLPDLTLETIDKIDILLVPGGRGTRAEVSNQSLMRWISNQTASCLYVTSVCTGSALLANSGVLDGRRATTNKNAFHWVAGFGDEVTWVKQARWVADGRIFTSSGVSAGIDMTLDVIASHLGEDQAIQAANWAEYSWHRDADDDPFARISGLVK